MSQFKPNYRWMERVGANRFRSKSKVVMCEQCARKDDCETLNQVAELEEMRGIDLKIDVCSEFEFALVFQSAKGLDAPVFNTMRLGSSWINRVDPGDYVSLVVKGEFYGRAKVLSKEFGDINTMVMTHAANNHLYVNDGRGRVEIGSEMLKKLPGIYGNLIYRNNIDKGMTVIELEPVIDED